MGGEGKFASWLGIRSLSTTHPARQGIPCQVRHRGDLLASWPAHRPARKQTPFRHPPPHPCWVRHHSRCRDLLAGWPVWRPDEKQIPFCCNPQPTHPTGIGWLVSWQAQRAWRGLLQFCRGWCPTPHPHRYGGAWKGSALGPGKDKRKKLLR